MARRRSGARRRGRQNFFVTNQRLPSFNSTDFNDAWLNDFRERGLGSVDLDRYEDRRRWHPSSTWPRSDLPPGGLRWRPRIVIVPDKHKLARLQTYGGRYSLKQVKNYHYTKSKHKKTPHSSTLVNSWDQFGRQSIIHTRLPHRVGFTLPWQVIVCVRRKRRKEVLFANRVAGVKGAMRRMFRKPRRNFYSEVRC